MAVGVQSTRALQTHVDATLSCWLLKKKKKKEITAEYT